MGPQSDHGFLNLSPRRIRSQLPPGFPRAVRVTIGAVLATLAVLPGAIDALIALPTAAVIQAFVSTHLERHDVVENVLARE